MEKKTIVEECKKHKNERGATVVYEDIGFYLEGEKVIFKHSIVGVDDADNWKEEETFPVEKYKSGIKELMEKGYCSIQGADLSKIGSVGCEIIHLRKISDNVISVYYHGLRAGDIYFHCDINKLVLK